MAHFVTFFWLLLPYLTNSFHIQLIHVDSPVSPFYNSSVTPYELMINSIRRTEARISRLYENTGSIELIQQNSVYLARINIGTPWVQITALADTGGNDIWLFCGNCGNRDCYKYKTIYNTRKSRSYNKARCSYWCNNTIPHPYCGTRYECMSSTRYGSGGEQTIEMEWGNEVFTFYSDNEMGGVDILNYQINFACAKTIGGDFSVVREGIIGLGGGDLSLISQLGQKIFTYCLLPENSKGYSLLNFGADAFTGQTGLSTHLYLTETANFYTIGLRGISVEGQKMVLARGGRLNMVVDSGTPMTILESTLFEAFAATITRALSNLTPYHIGGAKCYVVDGEFSLPDITFHFIGADITLHHTNTFSCRHITEQNRQRQVVCCLMIRAGQKPTATRRQLSIYGGFAQVNWQLQFNLEAEKLFLSI